MDAIAVLINYLGSPPYSFLKQTLFIIAFFGFPPLIVLAFLFIFKRVLLVCFYISEAVSSISYSISVKTREGKYLWLKEYWISSLSPKKNLPIYLDYNWSYDHFRDEYIRRLTGCKRNFL
jgi:hypothetical protein